MEAAAFIRWTWAVAEEKSNILDFYHEKKWSGKRE
jgi:hypothetical protein